MTAPNRVAVEAAKTAVRATHLWRIQNGYKTSDYDDDAIATLLVELDRLGRVEQELPNTRHFAHAYTAGWYAALDAYRKPGFAEWEAGWSKYRKALLTPVAERDDRDAGAADLAARDEHDEDEPTACPDCGHWIASHYVGDVRTGCGVCKCPHSQTDLAARDEEPA